MSRYYGFPKYVSVHERKQKSQRRIEKLKKKGLDLNPVIIEGKEITSTFWGDAWCEHIESFHDFENRLGRGRSYVRSGSVIDLKIEQGKISSLVEGSSLYTINIQINALSTTKWGALKKRCAGKIGSLIDLISGELSDETIEILCNKKEGLFPLASEIKLKCNCPDYSRLCKHLAAALYAVGNRLDKEPELLFLLRGVNQQDLIAVDSIKKMTFDKSSTSQEVASEDVATVFGIELDTIENTTTPTPTKKSVKKPAVKKKEMPKTTKVKKQIKAKPKNPKEPTKPKKKAQQKTTKKIKKVAEKKNKLKD